MARGPLLSQSQGGSKKLKQPRTFSQQHPQATKPKGLRNLKQHGQKKFIGDNSKNKVEKVRKKFSIKAAALSLICVSASSCSLLQDYPQNQLIQGVSTEAYKKCDELASDILQISYERAGENGGRFTNFITRSNDGSAVLFQLSDKRDFEVISDDEIVATAVYGSGFMGMVAISAAQEQSRNSGETMSKFIGDTALPEANDPRKILETNESLVCKVKFMTVGSEQPGFYKVSEDNEGYYYEATD